MVVLLALSLSIFAIPASSAEEPYLKKRNSILFDCYGKTKTPEQFSSCVAPQMTKSNGFLKDVSMNCNGAGLITVSCDSDDCFRGSQGSFVTFKSCVDSKMSLVEYYSTYFGSALFIKKHQSLREQIESIKTSLCPKAESYITAPGGFIFSEKQTEHLNFCLVTNIMIPFDELAKR